MTLPNKNKKKQPATQAGSTAGVLTHPELGFERSGAEQLVSPEQPASFEQPIIEHLTELRNRVLWSVLCVAAVFMTLFFFSAEIYNLLAKPLLAELPEHSHMIATNVASPFLTPLKLTAVVAVFLSMPYLLHQLWGFVSPGLYKKEKRFAVPLLISSVLLFYVGIGFAYFVVFPVMFAFFTSVAPAGVQVMTDMEQYFNFVVKIFFAFGVVFEVPVLTFLLVASRLISVQKLKDMRPYVVVGAFVVGMILTPPDLLSQFLLAVPMWLLFELGLFVASLVVKDSEPKDSELEDTKLKGTDVHGANP